MISDSYQRLVDVLVSLGFTVIDDNHPLRVSLEQLEYPVAILSNDSASGKARYGFVLMNYSVSLLWPGEPNYNYLASVNQAQAIAAEMDAESYVVTPLEHNTPEVSGGLVRLSVKSCLPYICKNPNIERS